VSIFGDFASVLGQGKQVWLYVFMSQCLYLEILRQCWGRGSNLPHVSVSIFGDFVSVLGQGKLVWLCVFMSQCLYLEILRECWGWGSKFDYTSSHLSVYF